MYLLLLTHLFRKPNKPFFPPSTRGVKSCYERLLNIQRNVSVCNLWCLLTVICFVVSFYIRAPSVSRTFSNLKVLRSLVYVHSHTCLSLFPSCIAFCYVSVIYLFHSYDLCSFIFCLLFEHFHFCKNIFLSFSSLLIFIV